MKKTLRKALWGLAAFVLSCGLGTVALFFIFGQFRSQSVNTYNAEFTNVSGLKKGDFVRIAGVEVGKVRGISMNPDLTLNVVFSADGSVVLTQGTRAAIRYDNVIGDRFLELRQGAGGVGLLNPGQTIPASRTDPALDLDALIGGFRPLFRALDPTQVNALTGQLVQILEGQSTAIGSFLAQTAALTGTLADHDQLIGQVITNLNTVMGSVADQSGQLDKSITSLSGLMSKLAARRTEISASVAYTNASAASIADLLAQARPPLKETIAQSDRVDSIVVADHDYFDNLLNTLPDAYQALSRQGMYGDFFTFYICDVALKLNGKGGQPVYVKVVGQDTGRCAPK